MNSNLTFIPNEKNQTDIYLPAGRKTRHPAGGFINKLTIKSILISLLFTPILVFILSPVEGFAHEPVTLPSAGLTPESPFYFIDKLGEALREFFTFNPETKAHLQIDFAAERIAEIKIILGTKGVEAKGLEVAQSRLQANIAKAAALIEGEKSKGKDVSELAKSINDNFDTNKEALKQVFKDQERALDTKEDELKIQLKAAHRAGDTAKEEALAQELGQVKAQKELLELKEEDIDDELETEEEKIEEEMEAQLKAEKAIREAEEEREDLIDEAAEEGVELPTNALAEFDSLLIQAKSELAAGNFVEAKNLAKRAEKSLDQIEKTIEELEKKQEKKEEAEEAIKETEEEKQEVLDKASKEGVELPPTAFAKFDRLLAQAKKLFAKENYRGAKQLAEQAEDALEDIDKEIEKLEKEKEKKEKQAKEEEERKREREEKQEEQTKDEEERKREQKEKRPSIQKTAPSLAELQGIWVTQDSYYEFKGSQICFGQLSNNLPEPCPDYYPFIVDGDTITLETPVPTVLKWAIKDVKLELVVQVTGQKLVLSKFVEPIAKLSAPKDYSISPTENQLKLQGVWKSSDSYISFKFYRFIWQGNAGSGEWCQEVIVSGSTTVCNGYTEFTLSGNNISGDNFDDFQFTLQDGRLTLAFGDDKAGGNQIYTKTAIPLPPFKGVVEN